MKISRRTVSHQHRQSLRKNSGSWIVISLLAFGCVVSTPAAASDSSHASGHFTSNGVTMPITYAYAFRGKASLGDGQVWVLAVSNTPFENATLDALPDPRDAIDERKSGPSIVYFEFDPNSAAYKGLSFYFGSGNGCGYCSDSAVQSTVKMAGAELRGKLEYAAPDGKRGFDIDVDVPVSGSKRITK